ncbi:MAG: HEAT repeat domain-containing protein [Acidimicrobiia bacterium]|nr:HEAT repeat domain-containing protein [Acidimicrobiia bacterium]
MDAAKLVKALSVAYGGVHLYPDPLAVPAFISAVDTIGDYADNSLVLGVTVDGFQHRHEPVEAAQGATDRLVQALFSQRVESLTVVDRPAPEEIASFFSHLDGEGDELELDLPTRLQLAGVTAIQVRCQDLLDDRDEEEDEEPDEPAVERHPDVQALFETDSVRRIADRVMAAPSPEAAADDFVEIYRSAYESVAADDPAGLERVVQTFVDAFFHLEHHYRSVVFESIIELRDETAFGNFLDQFSSDELAELAGAIKDAALPLLVEYARVVSEMAGRDPGLVDQVMGEREAADARGAVAGSVGVHLANFLKQEDDGERSIDALAGEIAELDGAPPVGWGVLGDLFSIEERSDRVGRLLRIWVAKLTRAIRERAFLDAVAWMRVAQEADLDSRLLDDAYGLAASDEILEILTSATGEHPEERNELLGQLSRRAGGRVIEQLAIEEDPGRRRMLIDVVTEIAKVDIRSVLAGLSDSRWYVVRNVVIALGKSGRKAAGEPLTRLIDHEDHRVRIEALRALLPCVGDASVDHLIHALGDEHVRVRALATDLLGTLDDGVVVPALASALRDETQAVENRVAVIEALGRHGDDSARVLLEEMADSKARFSASARALRSAARDALRSGHE